MMGSESSNMFMTNKQRLHNLINNPEPPAVEYVNVPPPISQPLHIQTEEVPRFEHDDPNMEKYLEEHGYVVVKSVASAEEVARAKLLLWEFLATACDMKEHDPTTWTDANMNRVGRTQNGIMNERGVNQSEFLWFIRMLPKVKAAFARIYKTESLLTSFDGGNIFRPWNLDPPIPDSDFVKTRGGWMHVDQGRRLKGLQCVQGLVTLTNASSETGGFCCIPGSHKSHDALMMVAGHGGGNFVHVPGDFPELRKKQILPICMAGDLVLWDSRCIHANTPALAGSAAAAVPELLRIVAYICMTPRHMATEAIVANRVRLFERGYGTGHWPHLMNFEVPEEGGGVILKRLAQVPAAQRALITGE
jgi:ectoine hydroxylase-related dioxygenase (phytanoyl-CoA dioxygenase family)